MEKTQKNPPFENQIDKIIAIQRKNYLITNNFDKMYEQYHILDVIKSYCELNGEVFEKNNDYQLLNYIFEKTSDNDIKLINQFLACKYKKISRLKKHIRNMFQVSQKTNLELKFLTFTFRNEALERSNEKTRRVQVSRWLKEHCMDYVGNIDYGTKNQREHYHAVVLMQPQIFSSFKDAVNDWYKSYGCLKAERVGTTNKDIAKIAKYITKLTRHSFKSTTKYCRLIYPKQRKDIDFL